jgi:hypothetical protein
MTGGSDRREMKLLLSAMLVLLVGCSGVVQAHALIR